MAVMDYLLGWILNFHPAISILLISLIVSLIITLAIRFLTNQSLMKDLRNELNELQKEMKELRNNPKKMSKINDRFMETNMKYMSHSMRPTFFTFIPIILVFGWLNSHIAYYPIEPEVPFTLTVEFQEGVEGYADLKQLPEGLRYYNDGLGDREIRGQKAAWILEGDEGQYEIFVLFKGKEYSKDIIISPEKVYAPVEKSFSTKGLFSSKKDENGLESITLSNKKVIPFEDVPVMQEIPWINGWGWFGTYFLFSIIFSMLFRKIFQVY